MLTKRKQYIFRLNTDDPKVIKKFFEAYKECMVEEIIIIPAEVKIEVKGKKVR